jgi:hypothetical protein
LSWRELAVYNQLNAPAIVNGGGRFLMANDCPHPGEVKFEEACCIVVRDKSPLLSNGLGEDIG